ncbi:MAG: hypothetical protein ACK45H_04595 [Bacteroidota bacterium]|jgi:hypothetical protein
MVRFITGLILFFFTSFAQSQIVLGDSDKEKEVKEKNKREIEGTTSIYGLANWSSTFRALTENEGLYAEPLEKRADEANLSVWSFGLGFRNRVHKHIFWDGGLAWYRNGESYLFTGADTSFAYQSYYNYIAMPLRLNVTFGENVEWYFGAGIIPQMFNGYRQEQQWETTTDSKGSETIKLRNSYNSFALSAVFNAGLTLNFDNGWGIIFSPELRVQLNSTYTKTSPYIHKARAYGFSVGLIRHI